MSDFQILQEMLSFIDSRIAQTALTMNGYYHYI